MTRVSIALFVLLAVGCAPAPAGPPRELQPIDDPAEDGSPFRVPQPHRERPSAIVYDAARERLWVALSGPESEPARSVVVLDARTFAIERRVEVGPFPVAMAIHPAGGHLIVLNRFARYASVVDLELQQVVGEVPTPYFSEAIAFDPSGEHAYIGNRWRDAVLRWTVAVEGAQFLATPEDDGTSARLQRGIPTIVNPRRVVFSGGRLLVSSETTLAIAAYDPVSGAELARHSPNAPVIDLAVVGEFVIILHTGSGTGHPPDTGRDGDRDGAPGDGTANVVFQDLQNEIDVLAFSDLRLLHRYTSDTIAGHDYRDVDPEFPTAGLELGAPDTWTPDRVAFLPPSDTWIVGGAMPERVLPFVRLGGAAAIAVLYGGSSQVQTFDVDGATGALSPAETGEELYRTAMGAIDGVFVGPELVVVSRLAESLAVLDLSVPSTGTFEDVVVGDVGGGRFPATDSELGEAFNTLTALFTVDGDQTCVHCHREGSPVAKDVAMPLLENPMFGTRLVMSYRGAGDTRPWFVEAGMDETNFFPVINEFGRRENFCCEGVDPRIWSRLPPLADCIATPELEGCQHVLHCEDDPPPECASRRYGSPYLTRDAHFRAAAQSVLGRETTFGDVLYTERLALDGTVERRPITLGFAGITQSLGVFLRTRGRLLPNPNAAVFGAEEALGELLYTSAETGCVSCHPLPTGALSEGAVSERGAPLPLSFPFVVSPLRDPVTGADVDRLTPGFLGTFPQSRQDEVGMRIGVTSVRGVWDRARYLHHGEAHSLREVLATPGHAGLHPGEVGRNERDGMPNTHGGTSHLSAEELEALAAFVETL